MKRDAVVKSSPRPIPRVLLQAKKNAAMRASGKGTPWDKGHWANRK